MLHRRPKSSFSYIHSVMDAKYMPSIHESDIRMQPPTFVLLSTEEKRVADAVSLRTYEVRKKERTTIQQFRTNVLDYLRLQGELQKQNEALRAEVRHLSTKNTQLGSEITSAANSKLEVAAAWSAHADTIHIRLCRVECEVRLLHQSTQQAQRDESAAVAQMGVAEACEASVVGELVSRDRRISALEEELMKIYTCYEAMVELNKTLNLVCRIGMGKGNDGNHGEKGNGTN